MRSLVLISCLLATIIGILEVCDARPQFPEPTYKIGKDGTITGGFSTASVTNEAGGPLSLGHGFSINTSFKKKPGQANISNTAKQTSLNVAYKNKFKNPGVKKINGKVDWKSYVQRRSLEKK